MVRMDPNRFKACLFKALADPIRLKILQILQKKEMCVNEMVTVLKIKQPLVSRHLKILKDHGIVADRKEGNRRIYRVTDPSIFKIINSIPPDLIDHLSKRIIEAKI